LSPLSAASFPPLPLYHQNPGIGAAILRRHAGRDGSAPILGRGVGCFSENPVPVRVWKVLKAACVAGFRIHALLGFCFDIRPGPWSECDTGENGRIIRFSSSQSQPGSLALQAGRQLRRLPFYSGSGFRGRGFSRFCLESLLIQSSLPYERKSVS
jgi:hypothetical protein